MKISTINNKSMKLKSILESFYKDFGAYCFGIMWDGKTMEIQCSKDGLRKWLNDNDLEINSVSDSGSPAYKYGNTTLFYVDNKKGENKL
jgi:hypothetical protein